MFFAIDQHRMSQHILQHGGAMGGMQHDNGNGMGIPNQSVPPSQQGMEGQHQHQQRVPGRQGGWAQQDMGGQHQQQHVPGRYGGSRGVPNSVQGGMPSGGGQGEGVHPTKGTIILAHAAHSLPRHSAIPSPPSPSP